MSWGSVRPHFASILESFGLDEWPDAFNTENIPSTLLNKSFHFEVIDITGFPISMADQETRMRISLQLFFPGYADTIDAVDDALLTCQQVVESVCDPASRLTNSIKNIIFNNMTLSPIATTNDNIALAEMEFEARIILQV